MPLLVKDYSWRQTENIIVIRVPLNGVHYSKVDIFSYESYLKAHFQPYLFEVFLFSSVKESESKCTFAEGEIVFELFKVKNMFWEKLEANLSKQEKQDMRKAIIEKSQEIAEAEKKKKSEKKQHLDRLAIKQQIEIDTQRREHIEGIKENEKRTTMKEFEEWKQSQQAKERKETKELSCQKMAAIPSGNVGNLLSENEYIFEEENEDEDEEDFEEVDYYEVQPMPLPRNCGKIQINFTERSFPTPKRESQEQEETEWLKNQAEARRKIGFAVEDLSPEELDPLWLKDKGDSFFKVGNYLGAISAYSHAIKLGSKLPALYSNRAAAHMAIGNNNKCIEDCSSVTRCHARRGTALCKLGMMREGMVELEAAIYLQPKDDKLRMDLEKARAMVDVTVDAEDLE
ncbi:Dyslexia susceptibility protein 1 [Blattella germanica]|nr:Dyslexia susceptibility protein 1 [Blattella germanica]